MKKILTVAVVVFAVIAVTFGMSKTKLNPMPSVSPNAGVANKVIDMSGQNITQVPWYAFSQTVIEELNLSSNALTGSLQSQIGQLKNLKILNLSNNKFTGVPAEIGLLQNLEVLNLSNNLLTGLPNELGNLSNLKLLDVSGNNYSETDLARIKSKLPASTVIKTE